MTSQTAAVMMLMMGKAPPLQPAETEGAAAVAVGLRQREEEIPGRGGRADGRGRLLRRRTARRRAERRRGGDGAEKKVLHSPGCPVSKEQMSLSPPKVLDLF